ncbi:16S rRNA (uracil(1498)-N(3))-methyltransferase [Paenarthrobacter aurescens]|uniref:Ribosomal RNA small subunit methyltransferase E n=1 Tax=Paenarthrobacter aurescens TaxID=43663 RepID=A0A4Y3NKU2_PAEAU|nr:16S rRNA (uracil(1498)-N(3))-methyltransferase [Paenarthrobacter aurescens]MDO6143679.1 16S rRNA (uracil(1498)-N(3))-methyltransferase [Paenarthrobacter aurescens]MDO6147527.1 16S rRNA (uracil(1498)-N(3))-methyltransferase [Paenarthrobacter aurescens]MDO6158770.1 16S rRNA (uracil(1498)-N(3))-methyltransferase [Paenarthrobacter aurescens]MDO6162754.1 16S rRNA (uracil(1498)-N(3))-methyltransferase [Paenarthrobacter aurescens]GEB19329.1 ribosomal RNA small subunit methyltransferase E [Paenarth
MSNPVFFAPAGSFGQLSPGSTFVLEGAEARHAVTVKRLAVGEPVDIADGAGARLIGTVMDTGSSTLTVQASEILVEDQPEIRLVLVQALAKGDRDELAIETATELGIDAVIPWQSERAIVRWKGDRAVKAHAKWQSVVTAAAKQARRAWIPEVRSIVDTGALAKAVAAADAAIILHEDAKNPLRAVLEETLAVMEGQAGTSREVLLIVGPEGGIAPREVTRLSDAGAVTALLGHHVLRSSTAGPAAVVLASDVLGRW